MNYLLKRVVLALVGATALITLARVRAVPGLTQILDFDVAASRWAVGHQTGWLNWVMTYVTALGAGLFVVFMTALVAAYAAITRKWAYLAVFVAATGGGAILSYAAKIWVARLRPDVGAHVVVVTSPAFPSGHAIHSVVCYGSLALLSGRRMAMVVAGVVMGAVGASRVFLGVHWPTDVIGGYILGGCWLVIVWSVYRLVTDKQENGTKVLPTTGPLQNA